MDPRRIPFDDVSVIIRMRMPSDKCSTSELDLIHEAFSVMLLDGDSCNMSQNLIDIRIHGWLSISL
jgi:hypothetical protein